MELLEAHRCVSPTKKKDRDKSRHIVHGVKLDSNRRRERFYFAKDDIDPLGLKSVGLNDLEPRDAYDEEGNRAVFHLYNPTRVSQTRGVSYLNPVADTTELISDTQFARLVQQQVASCFAVLIQRDAGWSGGT